MNFLWKERLPIDATHPSLALNPARQVLADSSVSPPSRDEERRLFWRLRTKLILRQIRETARVARFRLSLVAFLTVVFWAGLFILFAEGFQFLQSTLDHPAIYEQTVRVIFSLFFGSLMMMLVFSTGIILYSGLFVSPEMGFLLTTPARAEHLVQYKFQEALFLSSWGFLLLGSPMLFAFGVVSESPWYYFLLVLPYMVAFVFIPGSLGAIVCMLTVNRLPRLRLHFLVILTGLIVLLSGIFLWYAARTQANDAFTPEWIETVLGRLQYSEHRLLPSWWLSTGLLEAARGASAGRQHVAWSESVMFFAVLVANAMMSQLLVIAVGRRWLRGSYSGLHCGAAKRKPAGMTLMDQMIWIFTGFLSPQIRLLIIKDVRIFRRDPAQWSQFLIFFGLLLLYFMNMRRFHYEREQQMWVQMISFLNLAVVGLILSTFTTRFIFPMISLEGRRFWILSLLPLDRETILWGKFVFAAAGSVFPCGMLILLSDLMLGIAPSIVLVHQLTCVLLCVGLAGIAVGLGAIMPDLREHSPSKIAAGFGGTLNLVLSTAYITAIVALTAIPAHYYLSDLTSWRRVTSGQSASWFWLGGGIVAALVLCTLTTAIPLRMGMRAFRRLEH